MRKPFAQSHADARQLQAYLDGELPVAEQAHLTLHLQECVMCRASLEGWQALISAVCNTRPSASEFSSEGEFWAQLARRLPARRPATWGLLAYLPPVVLGVLGTILDLLLGAVFMAYAWLGPVALGKMLPSLSDRLPEILVDASLESRLTEWFGWSARTTLQEAIHQAEAWLGELRGEALFGGAVVLLAAFWAVIVVLYLSWVVCWSRTQIEKV